MTQAQWAALILKIVLIFAILVYCHFTIAYSRWAKWWKNPIGLTMVLEAVALALAYLPVVLSAFLVFSNFSKEVALWVLIFFFGCGPAIVEWRTIVMWRLNKAGKLIDATTQAGGKSAEVPAAEQD